MGTCYTYPYGISGKAKGTVINNNSVICRFKVSTGINLADIAFINCTTYD